eukprot:505966_1
MNKKKRSAGLHQFSPKLLIQIFQRYFCYQNDKSFVVNTFKTHEILGYICLNNMFEALQFILYSDVSILNDKQIWYLIKKMQRDHLIDQTQSNDEMNETSLELLKWCSNDRPKFYRLLSKFKIECIKKNRYSKEEVKKGTTFWTAICYSSHTNYKALDLVLNNKILSISDKYKLCM